MPRWFALVILVMLALVVGACQKSSPADGSGVSEAPAANAVAAEGAVAMERPAAGEGPAAPAHAPAGAKPGSHEDWCGEHAVPESLCTRCNASLVAAFKATGDWCEEHGLPQSQCTACNPELRIERPAPVKGP